MDEITQYKAFIKQISNEVDAWPQWKKDLFNQAFFLEKIIVKNKINSLQKIESRIQSLYLNRA